MTFNMSKINLLTFLFSLKTDFIVVTLGDKQFIEKRQLMIKYIEENQSTRLINLLNISTYFKAHV